MSFWKKKKFFIPAIIVVLLFFLSIDYSPRKGEPVYGASFSRFHTDELKLDWKETYLALLNDLGVKHFRFSAHWPTTEPKEGQYNFSELDFQMSKARDKGATVIIAVGRRLPGWPECHIPDWARDLTWTEQQARILKLIRTTVERYKDHGNIIY